MVNAIKFLILVLLLVGFKEASLAKENSSEIKTLSKKADVILTGKVTQKVSSWNDSETRIYTKTTVEVEEYLKGNKSENQVDIITPGGEVGDVGELYTHMPRFEDDEEVLVFLKKDKKTEEFKVLNGEDGKITVIKDSNSKDKSTDSTLKIEDLKAQIKKYINEQ